MADDAGALLVRAGLITAEHLAAARAGQQQDGGTISEHLVVSGMVSDEKLTEFYRTRLLVPQVHPNTLAKLSPSIIGLLPADLAAELRAIPVALDRDGNLTVAMSDPSDRHAVDEIGFFTGKYVVRAVATQMQIAWCLAQYYDCLTELGERLLQPVAAPSAPAQAPPAAPAAPAASTPDPAPAMPETMKPLVPQRGDTGRIEASRHKVLAPVTNPPPNVAVRPTAAVLDRGTPTPAPTAAATPAPVTAAAPAPVPLPRGAFGASTAESEAPDPSMWQPRTKPAAAVKAGFDGATVQAAFDGAAAQAAFAGAAGAPAMTGDVATPEATSEVFDDTPSIIINADFARPTRERVVAPDPPELAARTGELELIDLASKIFEQPTASIEINFGPDDDEAPPAAGAKGADADARDDLPGATAPASAAAFDATTQVGPAPVPASPAIPAAAPTADTRPMVALVRQPVLEPRAEPEAIPVATSEADTRRLSASTLKAAVQIAPPEVPASDGTPETIADAESGTGAEADAEAASEYETVPAGDDDTADEDSAALIHAKRPDADADQGRAATDDDRRAAVVEDDEDGTLSAPILLTARRSAELTAPPAPAPDVRAQAIVIESIDDASSPVLLTDRMRRREARRREKGTMIGIGHLGPIPRSVEPTPNPYALPSHAAPEVPPPDDAPAVPAHVADPAPAVPAPVPEAFSEGVATVRRALSFEEHDDLDDGWGAPGTTIPPGFIGAVPAEIHDQPSEPAPALLHAAPAAASATSATSASASASHPAVPAPVPARESRTEPLFSGGAAARTDRRTEKLPVMLPSIPPPRLTPPAARPAATLTPLNRNRAVAGVPDPSRLAALLEEASQRLVELLHGLDGATHRDHVIAMLVEFVGESHHRVAFLALRADELIPFMQIPETGGSPAHLDLRAAATFQDVIGTRLPYRGPISDPPSRDLVKALFGSATDEMLLVPVAVRDRVVGVIYADGRHRHSFDEHVTVAGRAAGLALQRILKEKKH